MTRWDRTGAPGEPGFVRVGCGFKSGEAGFTLMEALVLLGLLAVLAGLAIPAVASTSATARLERAAAEYAALLQDARSNAVAEAVSWAVDTPAGPNPTVALLRLEPGGVWQTDRSITLEGVEGVEVTPPGLSRVVFRPSGGPDQGCSVTLAASGRPDRTRSIAIAPATGRVSVSR
ncbi:MAG: hypothetical protein ACM3ZA_10945 [Bacillota bacterium]